MDLESHYKSLANMYHAAPINEFFPPSVTISKGCSEVGLAVRQDYFHAANSLHGSVYFKLLDDSAFFAANSIEPNVFVFTVKFTTTITKPVLSGFVKAQGKIDKIEGKKIWASSVMTDDLGEVVAKGEGLFLPSPHKLSDVESYKP
ncbi:PaaI family thioesterase [Temperatibacter marinus]|uniref:PaaI family thioesterase n=1 Tax=Temperatibacter marinus TaxID=1456591 RepID=A0AA52EHX0_9PROT|nr:PaaI family thioesterase [Temperatibacter marinus]WND02847.1 PaaI family thioesterase [Temperatibacter marinus]